MKDRRGLALLLTSLLLLGVGWTAPAARATDTTPAPTISRLAGTDRYATSAAISAATFSPGVPVVYLASGANFPDALSGGPVAAAAGGPILLVTATRVPAVIQAEIERLKPATIVALGGTSVVSDAVLASLASIAPVSRLAGTDRYATSAAISAATFSPGVPVVYLASGANFPDALSGGPVAAAAGGPILLVTATRVPAVIQAEIERLKPATIVALGGTSVVSDAVLASLASIAPVSRLAGTDRYATSAAISAATFSPGVPVVYLASGANFPDALSGGPVAAAAGGPILLVTATRVPAVIQAEIERLKPATIVALGGTSVVSDAVLYTAAGLTPPAPAIPPLPAKTSTKNVPILMYHRVSPTIDPGSTLPSLVVTPAQFESQMKALKAGGWHSITSRTLYEMVTAKVPIEAKTFVITFDDGRDDGYNYAFPIMKKYGFVGTYYIITSRINDTSSRYLNTTELQTLTEAGDEIANHTVGHVSLSAGSYTTDRTQIRRANDFIESAVGIRPISLAYPYGDCDTDAMSAARDEGIKIATTTREAVYTIGMTLLKAPRVRVARGDSAATLIFAMTH